MPRVTIHFRTTVLTSSPEPPPEHQSTRTVYSGQRRATWAVNDGQLRSTVADHPKPPSDHRQPPVNDGLPQVNGWVNGWVWGPRGLPCGMTINSLVWCCLDSRPRPLG
ncbi:hypothetical protein Tco_0227243 [Tanacetum coccineum]